MDAPDAAARTWTWRAAAVSGGRPAVRAPGDRRVQRRRQPDCAAIHVNREVQPESCRRSSGASASVTIRSWPREASPAPAHQVLVNGVIVTASGLLVWRRPRQPDSGLGYGYRAVSCGRRGSVETSSARRSCTRWTGRQYLLVPAASAPARGAGPGADSAARLGRCTRALPLEQ